MFFISGKILHALKSIFSTACLFSVLAITYDRFLGVCYPMNTYTKWRATSINRINITIWINSCAIGFPEIISFNEAVFIGSTSGPRTVCYTVLHQPFQRWYNSICSALFLFVFFISLYFMVRMTTSLLQSQKKMRSHRKTIILLVTVVFVFLLCLLPHRILTLLICIAPNMFVLRLAHTCCTNLFELLSILSLLHSALNPVMYNFWSRTFVIAFRDLLSIGKQRGDSNTAAYNHCRLRCDTNGGQFRQRSATCETVIEFAEE